jgi:hypothetical protein
MVSRVCYDSVRSGRKALWTAQKQAVIRLSDWSGTP